MTRIVALLTVVRAAGGGICGRGSGVSGYSVDVGCRARDDIGEIDKGSCVCAVVEYGCTVAVAGVWHGDHVVAGVVAEVDLF